MRLVDSDKFIGWTEEPTVKHLRKKLTLECIKLIREIYSQIESPKNLSNYSDEQLENYKRILNDIVEDMGF